MEKYSRKAEANLPDFGNHKQAELYFKNKHSENFVLMEVDVIDGEKIYFYNLILDIKQYNKGIKQLAEGGYTTGMEFIKSYQPIEINENGNVHMIH